LIAIEGDILVMFIHNISFQKKFTFAEGSTLYSQDAYIRSYLQLTAIIIIKSFITTSHKSLNLHYEHI